MPFERQHVPSALQEFILRCMFNVLLLELAVLPLFGIDSKALLTLGIVVALDLANRGFTKVWDSDSSRG